MLFSAGAVGRRGDLSVMNATNPLCACPSEDGGLTARPAPAPAWQNSIRKCPQEGQDEACEVLDEAVTT